MASGLATKDGGGEMGIVRLIWALPRAFWAGCTAATQGRRTRLAENIKRDGVLTSVPRGREN